MKQLMTVFVLAAGLVLGAFGSAFAGGSSFEALFVFSAPCGKPYPDGDKCDEKKYALSFELI